jgi:YVTN family beta-propeller protein
VYTWGYSAYLGGGAGDAARGVAVDAGGDVYLAGSTASGDFPTTPDAYDFQCGSVGACDSLSQDAWYARLNLGGDELAYATYLGGSQDDQARALALGAGGDVYLAGQTSSPDFPARGGAYDSTCGSDGACNGAFKPDAFVARFGESGGGGRVYLPLVLKQASQAPAGCAPYYLAGIRVGDGPRGMAVDAARGRVYVANYVSGSLSAIDAESLTVIDSVPGLPYAQDAAYDAGHDLIWVTNHQAGTVTPIDAEILLPLAPVPVGDGPWGVAYDPVHDFVYVVNSVDETISVVDAETRAVTATLEGAFDQPFQAAANPVTGKVYITNFDGNSVTVIDGVSMNSVDLGEVTQPYGVAVDETRDLVYVASVEGHRVVAIGSDPPGTAPRVLNLAAVYRGNDPPRPVPLRAVAVHPGIGPAGDGGHLWLTSLIADGGEENLALLMPKGLPGYFAASVPYDLAASRTTDVEVDRARNRVYLSGGTASGEVTVLGDGTDVCLISLGERDALGVGVLRPGP